MTRARKTVPGADAAEQSPQAPAQDQVNASEVIIYPLRSYMDGGEIKRRGGPGYAVPKRHADALIAQRVASAEKPLSDT